MASRQELKRLIGSQWSRRGHNTTLKPLEGHGKEGSDLQSGEAMGGDGGGAPGLNNYNYKQQDVHHKLVRRQVLSPDEMQDSEDLREPTSGQAGRSTTQVARDRSEQSILIRLFEDTFVSLKTSGCLELLGGTGTRVHTNSTLASGGEIQDHSSGRARLCLINNWSGARILQANGTVLWPSHRDASLQETFAEHSHPFLDYVAIEAAQNHNNHNHHQQQATAVSNSTPSVQSTAARLAYTSASSMISLLGVLANLLILLIIVINTKQKCPNFLSRTSQTSHTNYHFVLLFQLTLTGLLLSGYVLFSTTTTELPTSDPTGRLDPAWSQSSLAPLSIYLAPTGVPSPFDSLEQQRQRQFEDCSAPFSLLLRLAPIEPAEEPGGSATAAAYALQGGPTRVSQLIVNKRRNCNGPAMSKQDDQDHEQDDEQQEERVKPEVGPNPTQLIFDLVAAIHIWTVAALAYDRYCAIAYPLEYLRAVGTARAKSFLLVLWLVALLVIVLLPVAMELLETRAQPLPDDELLERLFANCSGFFGSGSSLGGSSDGNHDDNSQDTNDLSLGTSNQLARALARLWSLDAASQTVRDGRLQDQLANDVTTQGDSGLGGHEQLAGIIQLCLSCVTFVLVVVAPLVIVTTCNMSIYGIVKGHERRMSASSGSQQQSNCGGAGGEAGGNSTVAGLRHNLRLFRRDASFCSSAADQQELAIGGQNNCSETCSTGSSIFGKLIRASHQVGASMAYERSSHGSVSSADEHEACNLLADELRSMRPRTDGSHGPLSRKDFSNNFESHFRTTGEGFSSVMSSLQGGGKDQADNKSPRRRLVSLDRFATRQTTTTSSDSLRNKQEPLAIGPSVFMRRKKKLKRKLSDKEEHVGNGQGDEQQTLLENHNQQQQQQGYQRVPPAARHRGALAATEKCLSFDACSCHSGRSMQSNSNQQQHQQLQHSAPGQSPRHNASLLDSDGIMRQLKFAGLSFAGIAISELMKSDGRRALNRSSSYSMGNLTNSCGGLSNCSTGNKNLLAATSSLQQQQLQQQQQQQHQQRNSSAQQLDKKCSYVSLANYGAPYSRRYTTKLLNHSDMESLDSLSMSASASGHKQQSQAQFGNSSNCCYYKSHLYNTRNWQQATGVGSVGGCHHQQPPQHLNHLAQSSGRMQFNVVFNVVVWLILALLVCSLPQYCLMLLLRLSSSLSEPPPLGPACDNAMSLGVNPETILKSLMDFQQGEPEPSEESQQTSARNSNWRLIELCFVWLTCVCRLLFILMLPLNAWLYGIRSRSLKTTLRMMLRKYISKKQASIEIDQRRKSVMSMRSRESSIAGASCSNQVSLQSSPMNQSQLQHYQHQLAGGFQLAGNRQHYPVNSRVMRRCASFNLPPSFESHLHRQEKTANNMTTTAIEDHQDLRGIHTGGTNSATLKLQTNSIRFVLGDDPASPPEEAGLKVAGLNDEPGANAHPGLLDCFTLPAAPLGSSGGSRQLCTSQATSSNSSLASGSNRSLLSASIQSSQSAAFLLLHPVPVQPLAIAATASGPHSPPALGELQPPMGVLKGSRQRSRDARMRHQESCESACPPAGVARRRPPILVRVQSSPGKLVAGRLIHNSAPVPALESAGEQQVAPGPPDKSSTHHSNDDDQLKGDVLHLKLNATNCGHSSSNDIKLLVTAADEDQRETSELLPAGDSELPMQEPASGSSGRETDELSTEAKLETESGEQASDEAQDTMAKELAEQQRLDYFKQIKSAVTKYFVSLRLKRRRAQFAQRRPCSCCSLEFEPGSSSCPAAKDQTVSRKDSTSSQFHLMQSSSHRKGELSQDSGQCKLQTKARAHKFRRASLDGPAGLATSQRRSGKKRANGHSSTIIETTASSTSRPRRSGCLVAASSSSIGLGSLVANSPSHPMGPDRDIKPSLSIDSMVAKVPSLSKHQPMMQQQQEQSSYLKPPSSLKLIFDPLLGANQGNQALYSSSLALSPIKECSSNHSCASSQSSLNNVAQQATRHATEANLAQIT